MRRGFYFAELMILDTVNNVRRQMQVPKMVHRSKAYPNPAVARRCNSITDRNICDPGLSLSHDCDGKGGKLDSMGQVHSSQQWRNHVFKKARQDKIKRATKYWCVDTTSMETPCNMREMEKHGMINTPTSHFTFKPKRFSFLDYVQGNNGFDTSASYVTLHPAPQFQTNVSL